MTVTLILVFSTFVVQIPGFQSPSECWNAQPALTMHFIVAEQPTGRRIVPAISCVEDGQVIKGRA